MATARVCLDIMHPIAGHHKARVWASHQWRLQQAHIRAICVLCPSVRPTNTCRMTDPCQVLLHRLCVQVWQWLHHKVKLDDGQVLTTERFAKIMDEELAKLRQTLGAQRFDGGHFAEARSLFYNFSTSKKLADFLTLAAYDRLVQNSSRL